MTSLKQDIYYNIWYQHYEFNDTGAIAEVLFIVNLFKDFFKMLRNGLAKHENYKLEIIKICSFLSREQTSCSLPGLRTL